MNRPPGPSRRPLLRAAGTSLLVFALGLLSLPAFACDSPAASARQTIVLFDYSGAEQGEARNQYSLFKGALRDKITVWFDELADLRPAAPFLGDLGLHPRSGPLPDTLAGPSDLEEYWRRNQALELLRGGVVPGNGNFSVRSRIYLGELSGELGSTSVSVSLPISGNEFANANDSHSLVTYYALAMEAKRLQCAPGVVVGLLGKAREKAADLERRNMGDPEIQRIGRAIEAELATATQGNPP
jgi:hypothetical protein